MYKVFHQKYILFSYILNDCCLRPLKYPFLRKKYSSRKLKRLALRTDLPIWLPSPLAVCPWANHLSSPHLSLLVQKTGELTTALEDRRPVRVMHVECGARVPGPTRCLTDGAVLPPTGNYLQKPAQAVSTLNTIYKNNWFFKEHMENTDRYESKQSY